MTVLNFTSGEYTYTVYRKDVLVTATMHLPATLSRLWDEVGTQMPTLYYRGGAIGDFTDLECIIVITALELASRYKVRSSANGFCATSSPVLNADGNRWYCSLRADHENAEHVAYMDQTVCWRWSIAS